MNPMIALPTIAIPTYPSTNQYPFVRDDTSRDTLINQRFQRQSLHIPRLPLQQHVIKSPSFIIMAQLVLSQSQVIETLSSPTR